MSKSENKKRLKALKRRVKRARNFPVNTCTASRHLHLMADCLLKYGDYPMFREEPEHCAEAILAVIACLWEARSREQA